MSRRIFTVGHSNRMAGAFLELLALHGVHRVADVRRWPGSRRHPHFSRAALEAALTKSQIDYQWLGERLGGHKPELVPRERSRNSAWTTEGFRHYADHMTEPGFMSAVEQLEALAAEMPTAIMCAEASYAHCHRQLLADLLVVRGWDVRHLVDGDPPAAHVVTGSAKVEGGVLSYPASGDQLDLFDGGPA